MKKVSAKEAKKSWERLAYEPTLIWDKLTVAQEKAVNKMAEEYKAFLSACRTERKAAAWIREKAQAAGFGEPKKGAKKMVFLHRGKAAAVAWLGQKPLSEGLRVIGSHVDCPRLDLKAMPLYEESEVVFLKSQYYGGVKKYQWLARPLGLSGVAVKPDGRVVEVEIGFEPGDPVFTVADLLPHLAGKSQMSKKVTEAFQGEKLNLIVGSRPINNPEVKERFKLHLLEILNQRFDLVEEDLISAELEAVPADEPR
ncbi:MAG: hypothetical protein MI702_11850, partial [Chlorobiales bacterium]|nr:hypothetical protein [Chlorobiales bacterium]